MVIKMDQNTSLLNALSTGTSQARVSVVRQVPPKVDAAAAFAMVDDEPEVETVQTAEPAEDEVLEPEAEEFQMPDCIDAVPDGSYTTGTRLDIKLYNANCLSCTSLNPSGDKTFSKCHYTKGNPFCPASDIKLAFVGEQKIWAMKLNQAKTKGDAERVYNILLSLQDKDVAFRNLVLAEVGLIAS